MKVDILRNQKGDVSNVLRKEIDKGFLAGLKTFGCYALGVGNLLMTPYYLIDGGACKLLGLPFEMLFTKTACSIVQDLPSL